MINRQVAKYQGVFGALREVDRESMMRLHTRLVTEASAAGILDVVYRTLDTPVGRLLVAATRKGLVRVAYVDERRNGDDVLQQLASTISPRVLHAPARLDAVAQAIEEYFDRRRTVFDLPIDLRLAAGFRLRVLGSLRGIVYGATASYAELAAAAGSPRAARAVGSACATNPLPIIVPCHRVVRSDGALGQYVAGPEVKRALLRLEAT